MLWTPGSSQPADHVWLPVATHLATYISGRYQGKRLLSFVWVPCDGEEATTLFKVWLAASRNEVLFTASFGSVEISAYHRDHGFSHFGMDDPRSVERLLAWMQRTGVARKNEQWTDPS